jgi:hypothetical protein
LTGRQTLHFPHGECAASPIPQSPFPPCAHGADRQPTARVKTKPLPSAPNIEVVLRHFHRSRYRSGPLWFFCGEGLSPFLLFTLDERGGHDDLRGSVRLSIVPYVHRRTELYFCSSLPCLSLFFDPMKMAPARAFYSSRSSSYNETLSPDRWPQG